MVKIGSVFRMRSWKHIINKTDWVEFKSPDKNKVAVFAYLGEENKDGSGERIDPNERLELMGWIHPERLKVQAKFEVESDGVIGSTSAPVKEFSFEDDGSLTVTIDHWPTSTAVTTEMVEWAARALEKAEKQGTYGWTDEQFEVWWNADPLFVNKIKNWGHFSGTLKEKLLWETRLVLEAALA